MRSPPASFCRIAFQLDNDLQVAMDSDIDYTVIFMVVPGKYPDEYDSALTGELAPAVLSNCVQCHLICMSCLCWLHIQLALSYLSILLYVVFCTTNIIEKNKKKQKNCQPDRLDELYGY